MKGIDCADLHIPIQRRIRLGREIQACHTARAVSGAVEGITAGHEMVGISDEVGAAVGRDFTMRPNAGICSKGRTNDDFRVAVLLMWGCTNHSQVC